MDLLAALLLCTAGAAVAGTVGFGSALVTVPLIAIVDPSWIPVVPLVAYTAGSANTALLARHHIAWPRVRQQLAGYLPATVAAGWATAQVTADTRAIIAVAIAATAGVVIATRIRIPATRPRNAAAGAIAGTTGTLAGINGPPVVPLWAHDDPHVRAASLAAFFTAAKAAAVIATAAALQPGPDVWAAAAVGTVGALAGAQAGHTVRPHVSARAARHTTLALLAVACATAAVRLT